MNQDFTALSEDELWLCHLSCVPWSDPGQWARYFARAEEMLGAGVTHLDKNDPVRRRVKQGEVAEYVTNMGKREDSRWVFGKMEAIGVQFSIRHYRDVHGWPNSINWYFPAGFVEQAGSGRMVRSLFDHGNATLCPFYGYADAKRHISCKKKESGAVNIQAELIGVFWLTFFDQHYVGLIGKERFETLNGIDVSFENGATLDLAETPSSVPDGLRVRIETTLRSRLFVEPKDSTVKRPGEYALTFDQLRG